MITVIKSHKFLILFGLIILAMLLWFISRSNDLGTPELQGGPLPEETMVQLTSDGFSPKEVTIKTGTAVRWRNNQNTEGSVNSDEYPQNKLFPEMNLGKFTNGQTLVHVFNKSGVYKYHDQYHPENQGTIIVE